MSPRFSFIVPTYGRPGFLAEALESIAHQTTEDWECIVVDDASPEPASVEADERFRLVRRDVNGGPAAARNTGIDAARGEVIVFLDDDDLVTPERLEIAEVGLRQEPLVLCWGGAVGSDSGTRTQRWNGDVSDTILCATTPHLGQTALLRSVAPRFDERYLGAQDVEWWLRVARSCEVTTVEAVGWLWRKHSGERGVNSASRRIEGREHLLIDHADYFENHPNALAFQLRRLGLQRASINDMAGARRALLGSFKVRPSARTAAHLLKLAFGHRRRRFRDIGLDG